MSHHGRAGLMRLAPYHALWHTAEGVPNLQARRIFPQLCESFRRCHEKGFFRVVHFSVQGNHVHAVVEADNVESLSRGMQGLGVSMAKRVNRVTGRRGPVFDDRFYARALRSPREVANAVRYVLHNGEVHDRRMGVGVDRRGAPDSFSSAACKQDPPLTSPPATWLLSCGWLRAGPMRAAG
jgi:putative transposase